MDDGRETTMGFLFIFIFIYLESKVIYLWQIVGALVMIYIEKDVWEQSNTEQGFMVQSDAMRTCDQYD